MARDFAYVKVIFEIGHGASVRNKPTPDGFTHDWELFVRGADNTDIHFFVHKVVFHLDETFPNPERVVKEPPYVVKESGYAGFSIPIDIYVKNKYEPKIIRFNYELVLQERGLPPMSKVTRETYVFGVSDDFRRRLIKGGGTIVLSRDETEAKNSTSRSAILKRKLITNTNHLPTLPRKNIKKDNIKLDSNFATLFGSPIKHTKLPLTAKKSTSQKLSSLDKPQPKIKSSPHHKDDKKDKDKERDKEKKKLKALSVNNVKNPIPSSAILKRKLITNTNHLPTLPRKNIKKDNIKLDSNFATLFGSPIKHTKLPLTAKKSTSQKLSSLDKPQPKIKSSPHHKDDKKDKDKERDKEKKKLKALSVNNAKNPIPSSAILKRKLITNTNSLATPPRKKMKKDNIKLDSNFATLFGSPIKHTKLPLTAKKSTSQKLSSLDKPQPKIKSSPHHKDDKKDKDKERDKEKKKLKALSVNNAKNSIPSSAILKRKLITNTNSLPTPPRKKMKKDNIKLDSNFATLFGSPIQLAKFPLTAKKSTSQKLSSLDKPQPKIKSSPYHKDDKKDKDKERDKEKKKLKALSVNNAKNSTSRSTILKRKLITNTNSLPTPPRKKMKKDNIKLDSNFATLFGSPIQLAKFPLIATKSISQKLSSSDKQPVKIKSSPHHKEDKKDKDKERYKEKKE